jgi:hypothetical protein
MSPRRRRCRVLDWRPPLHDQYVLTNWKLRAAFVALGAGVGLWEALIFGWPLALGVAAGIVVALLKIRQEMRKHEPHD